MVLASVEHVSLESCTFGKHTPEFCIFYMAPIDLPEDSGANKASSNFQGW